MVGSSGEELDKLVAQEQAEKEKFLNMPCAELTQLANDNNAVAQFYLGTRYCLGIKVKEDTNSGIKYLIKAAETADISEEPRLVYAIKQFIASQIAAVSTIGQDAELIAQYENALKTIEEIVKKNSNANELQQQSDSVENVGFIAERHQSDAAGFAGKPGLPASFFANPVPNGLGVLEWGGKLQSAQIGINSPT